MLIKKDIDSLLSGGRTFQEFDGATITILGGTGFIGQWIIQALHEFGLNFGFSAEITVISRNASRARNLFAEKFGLTPNVVEFDFAVGLAELEKCDFFINGATPSTKKTGIDNVEAVYASTVNASNSIIRSAKRYGNKPRVVNLSSGIVYGTQGLAERNQIESASTIHPNSQSGYLNAKLSSESIFSEAAVLEEVKAISPRLYAFAGPGISLDEHFAVGNFIRDGLEGSQITISGNPSTTRSYLYPTDLVVWILAALTQPKDINVNVGSEIPITMLELATLVSELTSKMGVRVLGSNVVASNYVPSTSCFRENYAVSQQISLNEGLERWIEWLLTSGKVG
jgi:nucleoside-diphosphate-sugar epimerase